MSLLLGLEKRLNTVEEEPAGEKDEVKQNLARVDFEEKRESVPDNRESLLAPSQPKVLDDQQSNSAKTNETKTRCQNPRSK